MREYEQKCSMQYKTDKVIHNVKLEYSVCNDRMFIFCYRRLRFHKVWTAAGLSSLPHQQCPAVFTLC